jgi:hypothetical protein
MKEPTFQTDKPAYSIHDACVFYHRDENGQDTVYVGYSDVRIAFAFFGPRTDETEKRAQVFLDAFKEQMVR